MTPTDNPSAAGVTQADREIELTVVGQRCVYLNDYRIAGGKPYVSENLPQHTFKLRMSDILSAIPELARHRQASIAQHEGRGDIIKAVVEEAEQACRYVAKNNVANMKSGEYRDGFEAACEVCERAISEHVQRNDDRIPLSGRGEPVALLQEHPNGDRELELYRFGAGCLTDADKAAGWTEKPLYAHPPATRPAALAEDEVTSADRVVAAKCAHDGEWSVSGAKAVARYRQEIITQQAEEVARLKAEAQRLDVKSIHTCHDRCDRLACVQQREIARLRHDLERQMAIAKEHVNENARLRDALRPYSNAPCTCSPHSDKCNSCVARAALNEQPAGEG